MIRGLLALTLAISYCLLTTVVARAESSGLVVSPPFQEVSIGNGERSKSIELTLTNRSTAQQVLTPLLVDFKSLDESGGVAFVGLKGGQLLKKYGLADWLTLPPASITLAPQASTKVKINVENRVDLAPGGHYGAVVFRVEGDSAPKKGTNLNVQQLFASLILVKKTDGAVYGLKLVRAVAPSNWRADQPVVRLWLANTGNVHAVPRGTVELIDKRGRVVSKGIINTESAIVLPESDRVYRVPMRSLGELSDGKYQLKVLYRYDGSVKPIVYSQVVQIGTSIWVTILQLFVVLLAFALITVLFYSFSRRRLIK